MMGTILHMRRIYNPHVERVFVFNPVMDKRRPQDILAANIALLKGKTTYAKFPAKTSDGTINRVTKKDGGQNVRLSTLEALAKGFKLQAWELLVPSFNPARPPSKALEELEDLRIWRDKVMELAARDHGKLVDAGRADSSDGDSKGRGKQQEGRPKGNR